MSTGLSLCIRLGVVLEVGAFIMSHMCAGSGMEAAARAMISAESEAVLAAESIIQGLHDDGASKGSPSKRAASRLGGEGTMLHADMMQVISSVEKQLKYLVVERECLVDN